MWCEAILLLLKLKMNNLKGMISGILSSRKTPWFCDYSACFSVCLSICLHIYRELSESLIKKSIICYQKHTAECFAIKTLSSVLSNKSNNECKSTLKTKKHIQIHNFIVFQNCSESQNVPMSICRGLNNYDLLPQIFHGKVSNAKLPLTPGCNTLLATICDNTRSTAS